VTWTDLQGHAFIAGLLKCNFSYNCAAVDNYCESKKRVPP